MNNSFLELSQILTGFENLKPQIAELYYQQLHTANGDVLDKLLNTFDTTVKNQPGDQEALVGKNIWSNPAYKALCQSIILAWYNSAITTDPNNPWIAPVEVYYEALLWKAVEAHPPALSGGYFGYWRYAPEN